MMDLMAMRNHWKIIFARCGLLVCSTGKYFVCSMGNRWWAYCSRSEQHAIKCSSNVPMGLGIMVFISIGNYWCAQQEVMCSTGHYGCAQQEGMLGGPW